MTDQVIQPGTSQSDHEPPSRHDYSAEFASTDSLIADLEVRIIELEQALVSRRARRALRYRLRRAVRPFAWCGSFYAARLESATHEWLNGPRWLTEVRKGDQ